MKLQQALIASLTLAIILISAAPLSAQVANPVRDQVMIADGESRSVTLANVNDVFLSVGEYGVSLDSPSLGEAQIAANGDVVFTSQPGVHGSVEVTLTFDTLLLTLEDVFRLEIKPRVVHVDSEVAAPFGERDGCSWATAYGNFRRALNRSWPGQEIWVAKGTYYPDVTQFADTNERGKAFEVPYGVSVYGGFSGIEEKREERDFVSNLTILSGDITQDDLKQPIGSFAESQSGTANNSFHVVDLWFCAPGDVFDGFVVTSGSATANGYSWRTQGAGIYCGSAAPTISNCVFSGNDAKYEGGAIFSTSGAPTIFNCLFVGNRAGNEGGALWAGYGGMKIVNCQLRGNVAGKGGGIFGSTGLLEVTNCVVSGNRGILGAAGIHVAAGQLLLDTSTLSGNHSNGQGAGIKITGAYAPSWICNSIIWNNKSGNSTVIGASISFGSQAEAPNVSNCTVAGSGGSGTWNSSLGIDCGGNLDENPLFVSGIQPSTLVNVMGDFTLQSSSPAIDAGDADLLPLDFVDLDSDGDFLEFLPLDLAGRGRLSDQLDQGPYEHFAASFIDSDHDGLSDEFELLHFGSTTGLDPDSDLDGDRLSAIVEFVHGTDPGTRTDAIAKISVVGISDQSFMTTTYDINPAALQFVNVVVERCALLGGPEGWVAGETVEVSSRVSPRNPDLMEITERSIAPIGTTSTEFFRIRHENISAPGAIQNTSTNMVSSGSTSSLQVWLAGVLAN